MELRDYVSYDAVGLRELIQGGEVTAAEVEDAAREALAAAAPLNALAQPPFTAPLQHAESGPLYGVPFLLRDSGPMAAGVPFGLGSRALVGVVAQHDSDLMTRLRAAGLVTLGVTTVPEMCLSFATESVRHGRTRNPWDLERGVGGSSGGAAALVAAGAVPLAHGNDGAGSVRVPASCCGLVGLLPSRGRTPCGPDTGEAGFGMSQESGLCRTVRDAAHYLDAIRGAGVGDKYTAPPPGRPYAMEVREDVGTVRLRVAVAVEPWSDATVDPEVAAATTAVGQLLEDMGHLVSVDRPALQWDDVVQSMRTQAVAAAAPLLMAPRRPDPARLEAMSRQVLAEAAAATALDLLVGFYAQNRVTRSVGGFFTRYDLLATPTLATLPAPHAMLRWDEPGRTLEQWLRAMFDYGPFTAAFNVTGQPAVSLPLGTAGGLPVGVQLVAAYGREDLLLRVAAALERATPWHGMPPHGVGRNRG